MDNKMKGIDISTWQKNIDYKKLKNDGIEFAIIRCGYGRVETQKDSMFETHYKGLKKVGIKVGAYLYSYATSEADSILEAQNCMKFIKGKQFEFPIFYDIEDASQRNLGRKTLTNMCIAFCSELEKNGYYVGVYANLDWFKNRLDWNLLANKYQIWLAQWSSSHNKDFRVDLWQYTSDGQIRALNGRVDMNISYKDYSEIKEKGYNGFLKSNVDNVDKPVENLKSNVDNVYKPVENLKSNEEIAKEVIEGKWKNQPEREKLLTEAGYNYNEIQKIVNEMRNVSQEKNNSNIIKVGDKVKVKKAVQYNGKSFKTYYDVYDVLEVKDDRIVIGIDNVVTCAININNIEKV